MSLLPVKADYFDSETDQALAIHFHGCDFVDNKFYRFPSLPALIVGNSMQNQLIISDCNFQRNDFMTNNTIVSKSNR